MGYRRMSIVLHPFRSKLMWLIFELNSFILNVESWQSQ
jgi:hypothetical protein